MGIGSLRYRETAPMFDLSERLDSWCTYLLSKNANGLLLVEEKHETKMLRSNARSVQKLEPRIFETAMNKHRPPQDKVRSIEFENLQFAYPHRPDTRVLKGIFLRIEKGQFVAFVGASGCGKSTMIAMLERFYDPVRGTIQVDGEPLT